MKRVVVTGMGVVCPLGNQVGAFADALLEGRSGIGPIDLFDASELPTRIAGQSPLARPAPLGDRKIGFALEAAEGAMRQAFGEAAPPRGGTASLGVGLELFSMHDLVESRRPGFTLPPCREGLAARLSFMQTPSDLAVHLIARRYGLNRPPAIHVSACAAGTDALGEAFRRVRAGRATWALAGGTDSMINPLGVAGFCALNATSVRNEKPGAASRPFDRSRDGFVMGEGAAVLVLEPFDAARARGQSVLGEVLGYGNSFDAGKISDPHPEGRGAALAMARALSDAEITPAEVDAINAHGTGTPKNDVAETRAIKAVLGARAKQVPISATKSMIGHLISASGAVEAVAALECMRRGRVHPTINLSDPDPECDLDYVAEGARQHVQRIVLSSSFGFGGQNACLVLSRGPDVA